MFRVNVFIALYIMSVEMPLQFVNVTKSNGKYSFLIENIRIGGSRTSKSSVPKRHCSLCSVFEIQIVIRIS